MLVSHHAQTANHRKTSHIKKKLLSYLKVFVAIFVVAFLVIGVPCSINEAYKVGEGYITLWGAEDVFSYYGMVLTAFGAAFGIFISIKYSHKQYKEDKRRDVLPYFSINLLRQSRINPFDFFWYDDEELYTGSESGEISNALAYKEYLYNRCYFIFSKDKIEYKYELTEAQKQHLKIGFSAEEENEFREIWENNIFYIPVEIKNVGKGCAINTEIFIESHCSKRSISSVPISIPVGGEIYVGLYFDLNAGQQGEYDFKVQYCDIYGNKYLHIKTIKEEEKEEGGWCIEISKETTYCYVNEDFIHI